MLISENIKNKLIFGLIGFSATGIQIVFLREFFEVFNGNELSLGIVLAAWLFWTAIGSYLFGKIFSSKLELIRIIIIFEVLIAVIAPITLTAIKLMSSFLKSTPTEVLGLLPMIITAFALLPFFGIISGGLFPTAVLMFKDQNQKARAIGRVYLVESIGSALAGILLSLVLINFFTNLSICIMISIINCVFAVFLTSCLSQKKFNFTIYLLGFIWIAGILVSYNSIQSAIRIYSWKDFKLVAEVKSHFGRYSLIQTGKSKTMYLNGTSLFTIPDQAGAEESVHFALLQHPQPKNILLLGGGLNGSINEILKYSSVKLIDYVETDKRLIEFFKSDFSEQWREMNDDSRVKVHIIDARIFLRQQAMKYDVIILNQPDPQTAQLNRFFTVEFFQMVADRLNPSGIFSLQIHGSENYINNELADYLRCIYYSLSKVFTNVIVYPGDIIHFFAGIDSPDLTSDYQILIQRMRERNLQTQYIREYYLPFQLSVERIDYLSQIVQTQTPHRINRDFNPSAYYFNMILWSTQFSQFFIKFIRWIETLNWKIVFSIISILFTVFM
ncbi:MAG: fused MFS/spermidine synthase, partial [Calditrichaceae bacterium]